MALEFESTGEISDVVRMSDTLLSPDGCPWDREQTVMDFTKYFGNESAELIEAIESGDDDSIMEEVGDLMFLCAFLCRVAEKEGRFTLTDAVNEVVQKMIRRHPHVFGDVKVTSTEEVLENWQEIKRREKEEGIDKH